MRTGLCGWMRPVVISRATGGSLYPLAWRGSEKHATRMLRLAAVAALVSSVRQFRRGGVTEAEIMLLSGWKTRAMFDRYNITNRKDLARAVTKGFGSTN